jgi:hypothetical protein
VRLEVAFLDADQAAPSPARQTRDERARLTVLVVAAEADLRCYVRECLRDRAEFRVLEASSCAAAVAHAADDSPDFLVVDEPERAVTAALPHVPAIVIVDDVPGDATTVGARVRLLARPFATVALLAEVDRLLTPDTRER